MGATRHPPGRSGRMWLRARLAVARRGAELLDQKRQALMGETERMRVIAAGARRDWDTSMSAVRTWAARATVLAGEEHVAKVAAALGERAEAEVTWRSVMGVPYPGDAEIRLPAARAAPMAGTAAYELLEEAAREAVGAGLAFAAADRAHEILARELASTARRQRLVEKRRVPELEAELHRMELQLAEQERDEGVRSRWVARRLRSRT